MSNSNENLTTVKVYKDNLNNKFSFIKEKFLEGNLFMHSNPFTEKIFLEFREYIKTLEEMFPGNWNIEMSVSGSGAVKIQGFSIKLPTYTVTNSRGGSLNCKDMYLFTELGLLTRENRLIIQRNLSGIRGAISTSENIVDYLHSHLRSAKLSSIRDVASLQSYLNVANYRSFCEGSGEIINTRNRFNDQNSVNNFISYLVQVVRVATWESLDGGPFMKIQTVLDQQRSENSRNTLSDRLLDRRDSILDLNMSVVVLERIVELLLRNYLLVNPEFYVKFEEVVLENGLKKIELQNENELFLKLVESYIDLATKCNHQNDLISVARPNSRDLVPQDFTSISAIFGYKTTNNSGNIVEKNIIPRLVFLPENRERIVEDTNLEEIITNKVLTYFRGEAIIPRMYTSIPTGNTRESRLNLLTLNDLGVKDRFRKKILTIIKDKIKRNVENTRNER